MLRPPPTRPLCTVLENDTGLLQFLAYAVRFGVIPGALRSLAALLGLLERQPTTFLQTTDGITGWTPERIQAQIDARAEAKRAKNYAEADRIRKELQEAGIVLEDSAQGTRWRRA